jgi:hypothetical protein
MNNHLAPHTIEHEKTTTYDVGNPCPGLGQAQKCGSFKPVINGISFIPLLDFQRQYRYLKKKKKKKKPPQIRFNSKAPHKNE